MLSPSPALPASPGSQDSGCTRVTEVAEIYLGRDAGDGSFRVIPQAPFTSPPRAPTRLPALCKDQGTETRRRPSPPRPWGGLTDIAFAALKEKGFNGMKMSLITGAKPCAEQVQGDRDALVQTTAFSSHLD